MMFVTSKHVVIFLRVTICFLLSRLFGSIIIIIIIIMYVISWLRKQSVIWLTDQLIDWLVGQSCIQSINLSVSSSICYPIHKQPSLGFLFEERPGDSGRLNKCIHTALQNMFIANYCVWLVSTSKFEVLCT